MALSGMHITMGYIKKPTQQGGAYAGPYSPVYGAIYSSDTKTSAGTFGCSAPVETLSDQPIASVFSTVDAFISVGPSPGDPSVSTTPRRFIPAQTVVDFFLKPGDSVRWAPA